MSGPHHSSNSETGSPSRKAESTSDAERELENPQSENNTKIQAKSKLHWKTARKLESDLSIQIAKRAEVRNNVEDRLAQIKSLIEDPPKGQLLQKKVRIHSTILSRLEKELSSLDSQVSDLTARIGTSDLNESNQTMQFQESIIEAQYDLEELSKQLNSKPPSSRGDEEDINTDEQCIQSQNQMSHSTPIPESPHPSTSPPSPIIVKVIQEHAPRTPKFNGDFKAFREWSQLFETHVNSKDIPTIQKFEKLKECLSGAAKDEISHIDFSADQYEIALKRIHNTFGDQDDAEHQHVKEICALFSATELHRHDKLKHFHSTLSQNVLALIALGKSYESLSLLAVPNLLQALPRSLQIQFTDTFEDRRSNGDTRCELEALIDFLDRHVKIHRKLESKVSKSPHSKPPSPNGQNQKSSHTFTKKGNSQNRDHRSDNFSSTAENTDQNKSRKQTTPVCVFCEESHLSKNCKKPLTLDERKQKLTDNKACFRCLKRNHAASNCTANVTCSICSKKHYPLLCSKQNSSTMLSVSECDATTTILSSVSGENEETTLLPTGFAFVSNGNRMKKIRIILDTCSHRSYISLKTLSDLKSRPADSVTFSLGSLGGNVSNVKRFDIHNITLRSCFSDKKSFKIDCLGISEISKSKLSLVEESFGLSPIADHAGFDCDPTIELLLGADNLPKIELEEKKIFDGITATRTHLGWFFHGSKTSPLKQKPESFYAFSLYQPWQPEEPNELPTHTANSKNDIEFLWNSELLGIEPPNPKVEEVDEQDKELAEFFYKTVRRLEDGRYTVSLPFRSERLTALGDNEALTRSRLIRLLDNLKHNPDVLRTIDEEIRNYIANGFAEPAQPRKTGEPAHYLPIQAIIKSSPDYPSGKKTRIVKDASARSLDKASLNDTLHQGPSLLPDIIKVLLHCRRFQFLVCADICKAFLQFRINPDHRTFLRFLWPLGISENPRAKWREFWNTSLDFGLVCSPWLHCQGIRFHLESEAASDPKKAPLVREVIDTYFMDDLFTGADSLNEASQKIKLLFDIFQSGKFPLRKWASNSKELADFIKSTVPFPDVNVNFAESQAKLLGLKWNQVADTIGVFTGEALAELKSGKPTKRKLLKGLDSVFDPLGLLSPVTIRAKILLQSLWTKGRDWDDELVDQELSDFVEFQQTLERLADFKIPRSFATSGKQIKKRELHTFCDASLRAFGCVSYIRDIFEDDTTKVSFVASKARVTPLKSKSSIHRLELQGAVVAIRVASKISKYLEPPPSTKNFYTDNAACLGWIRDSTSRWKAFISNRTREIRNSSKPSDWSYVRSSHNCADILSRGRDIFQDEARIFWTEGPPWLKTHGCPNTPHNLNPGDDCTIAFESEKVASDCFASTTDPSRGSVSSTLDLALLERNNSWPKIVRIFAFNKRKPVESREIVPGDICLIQDPKPNRAMWPLCRVISCHGGTTTDGKKRSCVIRCANGRNYNRPIQALYKLEC